MSTLLGVLASSPELRREGKADFAIDEAFQAAGGVQLYFELIGPDGPAPLQGFAALDREGRLSAIKEPVHFAVTRLSYVVEKDVAFFSEDRLLDLGWMKAIAPSLQLTGRADGGIEVGQTPRSTLRLEFHPDASFVGDAASLGRGAPVLVQENTDFARVLGWRTCAWSATWTFHEALGPKRTRITALTLSYLYNVPPPFLGGSQRLFNETRDTALGVITRIREHRAP